MLGSVRQQLGYVGPTVWIEREADFFGRVAQDKGKEFTRLY